MSSENPVIPAEQALGRLAQSPDMFPQKIDFARNAVLTVELDAAAYRAASFLDDRILVPGVRGAWLPMRSFIAAAQLCAMGPLHFIFHTGHVGSTLLSRLLDESGSVLPLREPLALRNLADAADTLGRIDALLGPEEFHALLQSLLRLWSRAHRDTQHVVLKATSSAGRLAERMLAASASSRAIYMNLRAEPYLATLLAGRNSYLDLRGHAPERIRRLQASVRTPLRPLHELSLGELAALSWLAETCTQLATLRAQGERVMPLDFEGFLADVRGSMERVLRHLQLPLESAYLAGVANSPALLRYSKAADVAYSPQLRAQLLQQSRQDNAREIARGLAWLEALAGREPAIAEVLTFSEKTRDAN
jgi:hypothetical protein